MPQTDLAFVGCNGIHPTAGITNLNLPDAEIKTRVISRTTRTIVIADATKLGRADLALIAPLAAVDTLVTAGDSPHLADLATAGLSIVRADRLE